MVRGGRREEVEGFVKGFREEEGGGGMGGKAGMARVFAKRMKAACEEVLGKLGE